MRVLSLTGFYCNERREALKEKAFENDSIRYTLYPIF